MLIAHVCSLWYHPSLQVAVLCTREGESLPLASAQDLSIKASFNRSTLNKLKYWQSLNKSYGMQGLSTTLLSMSVSHTARGGRGKSKK
jgi:hypothetical protein